MSIRLKLILLILLTLISIGVVLTLRPVAQDPAYHHFTDSRTIFGIPNFANVISNFLFMVVGVQGLLVLSKSSASRRMSLIYAILFSGIFLTGLGSGHYHWHPDNDRLVYDRLPMTMVFMSLLAATIAEKINEKAGAYFLFPLLAIGIFSVIWWHYTEGKGQGDLRLYGLVQFYPMILIPLILLLFTETTANKADLQLIWVVIWYGVAKLCEIFDKPIFSALGFISGHPIKHIAAAIATLYLIKLFNSTLSN